ncbi:MAG: dihydrolipoyllysine-residue acetyltransferase [Methylococcales bacterium]
MATEQEILLPNIGDFTEVQVVEVLVKPGDTIAVEDPIISVESDKATMEIPSPVAGIIKKLNVSIGDAVREGSSVAIIEASEITEESPSETEPPVVEISQPPEKESPVEQKSPQPVEPKKLEPAASSFLDGKRKPHASPSVRRFARELGADLGNIRGSGKKGRILKDDVQSFIKAALHQGNQPILGGAGAPKAPEIDFSKFGEIESTPLSRIKKLSGGHVHRSWVSVPHVTQHDEADITELEAFRKSLKGEAERAGVRLTFLALLLKAVVDALKVHPEFNSSLAPDGESLILKKYYHIGFAVDTPDGLVVPVIRDVDKKGIFALAGEVVEISERARQGKLKPTELQGGCFTISSLGGIGGTAFTPIVNMPEVSILGVSRAKKQPVFSEAEGQFIPRLMLPLDLSYDHRVIDGAAAARFIVHLSRVLADLKRALL